MGWDAVSAIGTMLACILALFMPYFDIKIRNRKKLLFYIGVVTIIDCSNNQERRLRFTFLNIGFKDVIIHSLHIQTKKHLYNVNQEFHIPKTALPIKIETDNSASIDHHIESLSVFASNCIKTKEVKSKEKIVFKAYDTGGKTYVFKMKENYQFLVDSKNL